MKQRFKYEELDSNILSPHLEALVYNKYDSHQEEADTTNPMLVCVYDNIKAKAYK